MTNLSFRFGGFSVDFFNGFFFNPPPKRLDSTLDQLLYPIQPLEANGG